jgi:hypothetical protein
MSKSTLTFILKFSLIATPCAALAEPAQEFRCSTDSLTPAKALQRLEWARKCGLLQNSAGPNNWFPSAAALDLTFQPAKEYRELNTNQAFSGSLHNYNVNFYYANGRYQDSTVFKVTQETLGATRNYFKWSHTVERPQPLYPSFEDTPVPATGTQLFPHPSLADCRLYTDRNGTAPIAGEFYMITQCESSCYAPDQSLRFGKGDVNIVEAMRDKRDDLITLTPDATLDNLATQTQKVYSYTTEIRDAENTIFELFTASGGLLRVTSEHPVVTGEGRLVKASQLAEGDELLKPDGTTDVITAVEKTTHFGKVYNIKPMSREPVANLLIAQGYVVGSARFQNDDVRYINRVLLFRSIPDDKIPR